MGYLYETHLHTSQGSACGKVPGRDHVRYYQDMGYTGIIITDHFFGGNTAVDRHLPWEKRIDIFCSGYEDAKEEGEKIGLDVFFGWEQGFGDDEYLVYGLDKAYMKAHPEMEHWDRRTQLAEVHAAGGCVIQAHPFRMRSYMHYIRLGKPWCDGIEAANAANDDQNDAAALRYGLEFDLMMTAGSDNHCSPRPEGAPLFGVETNERLTSIQDYVKIILERRQLTLHVTEGRFRIPETIDLPESYWVSPDSRLSATGRDWLRERK